MELFIGGYAQGKTEYVRGLYKNRIIADEAFFDFSLEEEQLLDQIGNVLKCNEMILNHFHLIVRSMMTKNISCEKIKEVFLDLNNSHDIVIISDEIGNGVVPVERFERDYRELVGRLLIEIAKKSESVVRITCQIPMKLK